MVMVIGLSEDAFEQFREQRYKSAFDNVKNERRDHVPAFAFGYLRSSLLRAHEHLALGNDDHALIELAAAIGCLDGVDVKFFGRVRPVDPLDTRGVLT